MTKIQRSLSIQKVICVTLKNVYLINVQLWLVLSIHRQPIFTSEIAVVHWLIQHLNFIYILKVTKMTSKMNFHQQVSAIPMVVLFIRIHSISRIKIILDHQIFPYLVLHHSEFSNAISIAQQVQLPKVLTFAAATVVPVLHTLVQVSRHSNLESFNYVWPITLSTLGRSHPLV